MASITDTLPTSTGVVQGRTIVLPIFEGPSGYAYNAQGYDGAQATIEYAHYKLHAGKHFVLSNTITGIGAGVSKYWRITAGASLAPHLVTDLSATLAGTFTLYEAPTLNAGAPGTAYTPINSNRNSLTAATASCAYNEGVTADGTQLWSVDVGAASGPVRIGGGSSSRNEVILRLSTIYVVRFTAIGAGTSATCNMMWYEES